MRIFGKRQDNTTNTDKPASFVQFGVGGISNGLSKAITFPVAFKNVPIVLVCGAGGDPSTATFAYPAVNPGAYADRVYAAGNQSTTGFTVTVSGASVVSTNIAEFSWIAIGDM